MLDIGFKKVLAKKLRKEKELLCKDKKASLPEPDVPSNPVRRIINKPSQPQEALVPLPRAKFLGMKDNLTIY